MRPIVSFAVAAIVIVTTEFAFAQDPVKLSP